MKHELLDHLYDKSYPLALLAAEMQQKLDELEIYKLALAQVCEDYGHSDDLGPDDYENIKPKNYLKAAKKTFNNTTSRMSDNTTL